MGMTALVAMLVWGGWGGRNESMWMDGWVEACG